VETNNLIVSSGIESCCKKCRIFGSDFFWGFDLFVIIGVGIALLCVIGGFIMAGGNVGVLIQPSEMVVICGAALGSFIAANGMDNVKSTITAVLNLLKPDPYVLKATYLDLLKMMFQLFTVARKDGLLGLEKHIEEPETSEIISKYPSFINNHHAVHFFCDTMKIVLTGSVSPHDLSDMMELDLEMAHQQENLPVTAVQTVGDAMPGFGIVAAV
jgi:chemotaxis protein MotA